MGTVAAGAGVIGGTGAFTSVEAERQVSVETAGDANAALAILPVADPDDSDEIGANSDEYTNADNLDAEYDTLAIQVDGNSSGNGINNGGLNIDATTRIEDLFTLSNNGTQEVELSFSLSDDVDGLLDPNDTGSDVGAIKLLVGDGSGSYTDENEIELTGNNTGSFVPTSPDSNLTIPSGETAPNFGLEFDIPDDVDTSVSFSPELTIRASST